MARRTDRRKGDDTMNTKTLLLRYTLILALFALGWVIAPATAAAADAAPAGQFFQALQQLCGKRFAGAIVADQPPPAADDPFTGRALEMHVRDCSADEVRIPFAVGEDRSRTWVITRTATGLRLKHDHRHSDGTPDVLTMYGGDTVAPGTAQRQSFPADAETLALFKAQDRTVSLTNVWALELVAGRYFIYELARPTGRLFRVRFDLADRAP
jgi:hypothetical protein